MSRSNIKLPIALQKGTNALVNAIDVENGINCNCYCQACNEDLIAVNREVKQKAHFRHNVSSNCPFKNNFESYIHWLAKEIFSQMEYINLPPIYYSHLPLSPIAHKKFITNLKNQLNKAGFLDEFGGSNLILPNTILQGMQRLKIDSYAIEQQFKTPYGDIRVDIALKVGENLLFVEPFFTNKVDDNKRKKIQSINIPTISINLFEFIRNAGNYFNISDFRTFLIDNVYHKEWIFIREEKASRLIESIFNENFHRKLNELTKIIEVNRNLTKTINEKIEKRNTLYFEADKIQTEINQLCASLKEISLIGLFTK